MLKIMISEQERETLINAAEAYVRAAKTHVSAAEEKLDELRRAYSPAAMAVGGKSIMYRTRMIELDRKYADQTFGSVLGSLWEID